jgi:muramoyltetrapeptide carboxypeptidase
MKVPQNIKPGSKIRIVSPAGKIDKKKVLPVVQWFEENGYRVELGKSVFAKHFQFAGTNEQRLEDLQIAFDDPETDVIICSRGGYGTVRIIDKLDFAKFAKNPKWLVGFSDITMLHLALHRVGIASAHAAMPAFLFVENGEPNENFISLMNLLAGEKLSYSIPQNKNNRTGHAKAQLIGGNLSIIASLLGTKYAPATEGKILFIEDVDEYLYHIDRLIHQLKLSGILEGLAGLVVGDFTAIKDNKSPFGETVEEIITEAVKSYGFPVCFGFQAGHDKLNRALAFGEKWELNVTATGTTFNLTQ